jgi:hypothetical protein
MKDPRNLAIIVLVGLAAFLLGNTRGGGEALGQGYPGGTTDSNGKMIAVTGTIGSGVSVLWLIDTETNHLAVYQCTGGKVIELVAARNVKWDLQIDEFHDESEYSPSELENVLRKMSRKGRGRPVPEKEDPKGQKPQEPGD